MIYGTMLKMITIAVVFLTIAAAIPNGRPRYIDCVNSNECGKNECCKIGLGRFSIPSCRPRLDRDESCSSSSVPQSVNVTYPDGARVMLTNIYYNICPCNEGLTCHRDTGSSERRCQYRSVVHKSVAFNIFHFTHQQWSSRND